MNKHRHTTLVCCSLFLAAACSGSSGTTGSTSSGSASGSTTSASGTTAGATTGQVSGTTAGATSGSTSSVGTTGGASAGTSGTTGTASTLTGAGAFPVTSTYVDFGIPTNAVSTPALLPNGQPAAVAIVFANLDAFPSQCSSANGVPPPTYQVVGVQVASTGYIESTGEGWDAGPPVAALTPGVYPVGDEGVNDEDLSMLAPGSQAIVAYAFSDGGVNGGSGCSGPCLWALSGTVTLTSISDAGAAGSFDVILGSDQLPFIDAGELRGTFDTTSVCPGE